MKLNTAVKILLADDEPHILQFLELGLSNEGFDVRTAPDGATALEVASEFQPHMVILDVMMPEMDGFEVVERLRSAGHPVGVIMLTARMKWNTGSEGYGSVPMTT